MTTIETSEITADAFAEKLFTSFVASLEILGFYAGERLGWFQALVDHGPATSAELAERTGTSERYAREWLEMQATFGHLTLTDPECSSPTPARPRPP